MKVLWIFDWDALWALGPACGTLWALGGAGPKLFRRLGVPLVTALSAWSVEVAWWLCLLTALLILGALTLPYGEKMKAKLKEFYWLWLFLVGSLYGLSLVLLPIASKTWTIWLIGSGVLGGLFLLLTASSQLFGKPEWKFVEITTGMAFGFLAARLLGV